MLIMCQCSFINCDEGALLMKLTMGKLSDGSGHREISVPSFQFCCEVLLKKSSWEGGSGWGTHVNPWLFHFNV